MLSTQIEKALIDYNVSVNGNAIDLKYNKRKLLIDEMVSKYTKMEERYVVIANIVTNITILVCF